MRERNRGGGRVGSTLQRANALEGLTLLEMLIVLALLTISVAVAAPVFIRTQPSDDASLHDALRSARTDAIRSGRITVWEADGQRLVFLPDGSSSGGVVVVDGHRYVVQPQTGAIRATD